LNQDSVPAAQGGKQWYAATIRNVLLRTHPMLRRLSAALPAVPV